MGKFSIFSGLIRYHKKERDVREKERERRKGFTLNNILNNLIKLEMTLEWLLPKKLVDTTRSHFLVFLRSYSLSFYTYLIIAYFYNIIGDSKKINES